MSDIGLDRIIFGLVTLPFVIFAFIRVFIRENRLVDDTFIERAREEIKTLRETCDRLSHRLDEKDREFTTRLDHKDREIDDLRQQVRRERWQNVRLRDELTRLRAQLGLSDPTIPNADEAEG